MATHKLPESEPEPEPDRRVRFSAYAHALIEDAGQDGIPRLGSRSCMNCGEPHMGEDGWCRRCEERAQVEISEARYTRILRARLSDQRYRAQCCRSVGNVDGAIFHEQYARELEHELEQRR